jgi:hypothetical protein
MPLNLVLYLILYVLNKIKIRGVAWPFNIRNTLYSQVLLCLF